MKKLLLPFLAVLLSTACSKHDKIDTKKENLVFERPPVSAPPPEEKAAAVAKRIEEKVQQDKLFRYPELTVELTAKNPAKAARLVKAAGGRVLYDPNLGEGGQIPFLVVNLPPEKLVDKAFLGSLELDDAHVASETARPTPILRPNAGPDGNRNLYVPWGDIRLNELRSRKPGEGLGESTTIAVIDTGVDASHPAMEDRVVYWADHTQQTRTALQEAKAADGKVAVTKDLSVSPPEALDPAGPFFSGLIDEQALAVQNKEEDRDERNPGLDINRNGAKDDVFPVLVGKEKATGLWLAYVGTKGGDFSERDLATPIADFNDIRAARACKGESAPDRKVFLDFPSRNRRLSFPLLIEREDGRPVFLGLGMDLIDHGTHVAGIAAGHGLKVEGAAPKANIMSLKVCSGWSCTGEAIIRGLVDAFYNPYGCVPDVVNVSLGSTLGAELSEYDALLRDLSAKFGATFFFSAGNSGPGYRTINAMGASGPAVIVGASLSRDAFQRHYNASPNSSIPDQMMFFFSSAGPSFTGLLRPHIAAPGSALSSVPLADGGLEMMQGTSMASPIATGAAAALLSLAKKTPEYAKFAGMRERKLRSVLHPVGGGEAITLQQFPLALRASLEETARRLEGYTDPTQGFGLIDLQAAYDNFVQKLRNVDKPLFAEFSVNGNTDEKALYSRSAELAPARDVELALIEDKEAPEQDVVAVRGSDLHVKLDYAEVQDSLGHVQHLTYNMPFALMQPGEQAQEGTAATLVVANPVAGTFRSLRKLSQMEAGKTYVAHYSLSRENQVVDTLVDVVHKPIELGDAPGTFDDLSGLSIEPLKKTAAFVKKAQPIKATEVHRYPILLTGRDQGLSLQVGIPQGMNGALYVDVYGPNGKKVAEEAAARLPGSVKPVARAYVKTGGQPGIYEITVAAASGRWLSDSQYDLLAVADRVRVLKSSLALATVRGKAPLPHAATITVMNSSRQATGIQAKFEGLSRMERLEKVALLPQHWTFRRIRLPEKSAGVDATDVSVSFGPVLAGLRGFEGRIDNHLYALAANGESFTPVYTAVKQGPAAGEKKFVAEEKLFPGVKLDGKELYVALEAFNLQLGPKEEAFGDIDVSYDDVPVPGMDGLKAVVVKEESTKDVIVLKVTAPELLDLPAAEKPGVALGGALLLRFEGAESGKPFVVPVTVSQ